MLARGKGAIAAAAPGKHPICLPSPIGWGKVAGDRMGARCISANIYWISPSTYMLSGLELSAASVAFVRLRFRKKKNKYRGTAMVYCKSAYST